MALNYLSIKDLADDVGARLDIGSPTASTVPTSTQILQWLNLAQTDIIGRAVNEALKPLWKQNSETIGGGKIQPVVGSLNYFYYRGLTDDGANDINDVERIVSAEYWPHGFTAFSNVGVFVILPHEEAINSLVRGDISVSMTNPVGWVRDQKFYFYVGSTQPHAGDSVRINYIKVPTKIVSAGWASTYPDFPLHFQESMIQFALIRAKLQDQKIEEIPALESEYKQRILEINQLALANYAKVVAELIK